MTEETLTVEIVRGDDGVRITDYNATQAALAKLEEQYKGMVFEVSTPKGMTEAKDARKRLRGLRTGLEARRKELKAPVLDYTRALDGQAKQITARIEALENPVDQQIKDEEARKAREKAEAEAAERKRTDANRSFIEKIRNRPLDMIGSKAAEIWDAFQEVQGVDLTAVDEDFHTEASLVKDEAAGKLHELYSQAQESEAAAIRENVARVEREKAEAEAKAKREAEREAELAELEELRSFKAKQEEAEKVRAARNALDKARTAPPKETGYDVAGGSDQTVEMTIPAPPIEKERGRPILDEIDMIAISERTEARDSLIEAMIPAMTMEYEEGELEEVAEAILGEIIAGRITHVDYIGTPSMEDGA